LRHQAAALFGSGMSVPAGLPGVTEITELVRTGSGVWQHTDGRYFVDATRTRTNKRDDVTRAVLMFIKLAEERLKKYYREKDLGSPSYEDIFYIIDRVSSELDAKIHDPAVSSFIDAEISSIYEESSNELSNYHSRTMSQLAGEALHLIADIVRILLLRQPTSIKYLSKLLGLMNELGIRDLFKLNHDNLMAPAA
jgi:hypothetical protein